jgi:hypothetical protein
MSGSRKEIEDGRKIAKTGGWKGFSDNLKDKSIGKTEEPYF